MFFFSKQQKKQWMFFFSSVDDLGSIAMSTIFYFLLFFDILKINSKNISDIENISDSRPFAELEIFSSAVREAHTSRHNGGPI